MIGGYSVITQDVLPVRYHREQREMKVFGANNTGLERRGFSAGLDRALHKAFRLLTRSGLNTSQAVERIRAESRADRRRWTNCWNSSPLHNAGSSNSDAHTG